MAETIQLAMTETETEPTETVSQQQLQQLQQLQQVELDSFVGLLEQEQDFSKADPSQLLMAGGLGAVSCYLVLLLNLLLF